MLITALHAQTFGVSKECVFAYPGLQVPHSEGTVPGARQGYRVSQPQVLKCKNMNRKAAQWTTYLHPTSTMDNRARALYYPCFHQLPLLQSSEYSI